MDTNGNDIRNNIYLPKGTWIDYFSGREYTGGSVINSFNAPLWKLPVFVKQGAIIPMNAPNNHVSEIDNSLRIYEIYPFQKSAFTQYDDDGITESYKKGEGATTLIESGVSGDVANIIVHRSKGNFEGFVKKKSTIFKINVTARPKNVEVSVGEKKQKISEVKSLQSFEKSSNVYFYNAAPDLNQFATKGSDFAKVKMIKNPQVWVKVLPTDITANEIKVMLKGFQFKPENNSETHTGSLSAPANFHAVDSNITAYAITLNWSAVSNADYYEITFKGMRYTTIRSTHFLFNNLQPESEYHFKIRAVNKDGYSEWTNVTAKTKVNPLEFAIHNITATSSAQDEEGNEINKLVDFDDRSMWHTKYEQKSVPFSIILDLKTVNQLDRFEYLPRMNGRNGVILKGKVEYSADNNKWIPAGSFNWLQDNTAKTFQFKNHPSARFIRLSVSDAVNDYGSGREIYVFKVPGSESGVK